MFVNFPFVRPFLPAVNGTQVDGREIVVRSEGVGDPLACCLRGGIADTLRREGRLAVEDRRGWFLALDSRPVGQSEEGFVARRGEQIDPAEHRYGLDRGALGLALTVRWLACSSRPLAPTA